MVVLFYPSQGFFNCIIFVRPRYLRVREVRPEKGRWWAVRDAIWNPSAKYQRKSTSGFQNSSSRKSEDDSKRSLPAGQESGRCNVQEGEEGNEGRNQGVEEQ